MTGGSRLAGMLRSLLIPTLAVLTALALGALVILSAGESLADGLDKMVRGYYGLLDGALLKPHALTNTLVAATPLILTGLAVAIPFKVGLFNIGGEGQYLMGATLGVWVGYAVEMPPVIHMLVVLMAGFVGGALWAAIAAVLKARLGSHEVINTIMLNWIAFHLNDWLVSGPMKAEGPSVERTPFILPTAELPRLLPSPDRLHLGFFVAILACVFCWWLLWKTTIGFSIRTTGANPDAARYAGIKPNRQIILAMMLAGGLAGLAGVIDVQGLTYTLPRAFSSGLAFDAIAVSLLAFNHPIGIIPSALLFGALRTGADIFQIRTQLSKYIISINMALILLFVSAPAIVRWIYRIKSRPEEEQAVPLTRGWGG